MNKHACRKCISSELSFSEEFIEEVMEVVFDEMWEKEYVVFCPCCGINGWIDEEDISYEFLEIIKQHKVDIRRPDLVWGLNTYEKVPMTCHYLLEHVMDGCEVEE